MSSMLQISLSYTPRPNKKNPSPKPPARDMRISFGKHKGKMLGTLPSKYLTWVANNLRAGDTLHWAELADEVLQDPVYKDRIEWEHAADILAGNGRRFRGGEDSVSGLLDLSGRFGWDNEDKVGWSRVDFELLGTSKGGRIPRKKGSGRREEEGGKKEERRVREVESGFGVGRNPFPGRAALLDRIRRKLSTGAGAAWIGFEYINCISEVKNAFERYSWML